MNLTRDDISAIVICGATSGLFAAGVNIAARFTADPSDVLGFVGAAAGAGAAIAGTIWIDRSKENRAKIADRNELGLAYLSLAGAAENAWVLPLEYLQSNLATIQQTVEAISSVNARHPATSTMLLMRTANLDYWVRRVMPQIASALQEIEGGTSSLTAIRERLKPYLGILINSACYVTEAKDLWPKEVTISADQYRRNLIALEEGEVCE